MPFCQRRADTKSVTPMITTEDQISGTHPPESLPPKPPTKTSAIPGWVRVIILIPMFFVVIGVFEILGSLALGISIFDVGGDRSVPQMTVLQAFNFAGTTLLLYFMMRAIDWEPFINLGFHAKGRRPDVFIGIIAGLIFMVGGFAVLQATGYLTVERYVFDFGELMWLLVLFVFVAFSEEMLLRGYVLKNLMLSMNKFVALVVSSFMFSILHALNPNFTWFSFVSLFLAGIALGITYIYTKNLWFPIAFHFSWNFFQSIMGFNVSGIDMYSMVETTPSMENPKISGGAFGLEGSVIALAFEVMVIVCAVVYFERKKRKPAASNGFKAV